VVCHWLPIQIGQDFPRPFQRNEVIGLRPTYV
jgi:hypothetical protein